MEVLDQLEQRISALLTGMERLTAENAALRESRARDAEALAEENRQLKQALEHERGRNAEALVRVEKLVERIRVKTDQE